jgi:phage gp37-like protein
MIAAIELALLEQLRAAGEAGTLGYEYVVLDTFPDEFEEYLRSIGNLRTPAAWAVFLGMDQGEDGVDETGWTARCRFALVVAASNLRNEQQTRHGDGALPGSYQLAEDAIRLLSRSDIGLPLVSPIMVRGARLVSRSEQMVRQKLSLIAIELDCRAPFGAFLPEAGEFQTLHVDWDVPPHGNVAPPLPAEVHDAEDLIGVPQDA